MQGYTLFFLSLSSYCSCSNIFFLIFCGGFIWKFSSFIYSHASCNLTLHLQSSSSSLGHLSHQTPVECGRMSYLAVNLLFRGYFLINVVDKIVANHLMRRQQASFHRKFLSTTLTLSLSKHHSLCLDFQEIFCLFPSSPWVTPLLRLKVLSPEE